jgi:hypothetical protein
MHHPCRAHFYNKVTRLLAPAVAQISHIQHHTQTIHLLTQYIYHSIDSDLADNISTEVHHMLSDILRAHNSGISALIETIECVQNCLEVSLLSCGL